MNKKSAISREDELNLLQLSLSGNHLQELKDYSVAEEQTRQALHERHRQEMAQISMLFNPFGWAMAIRRYIKQLLEASAVEKFKRSLIEVRQDQETAELNKWIKQQKQTLHEAHQTDMLIVDHFNELFNWRFSRWQRQQYYRALCNGYVLILTDTAKSILWASRNFSLMTGYHPVDVVGKTPGFLQGVATSQATVHYIGEQLAKGQAVEAEVINYRKNGSPYLCHLCIKPLCNGQGELTHFMAIENEVRTN